MTTDLELEIEFAKRLFEFAQTVRCSKRRPDLAAVAAKREIQFKQELEQLEAEAHKGEQGDHQKAA